MGKALALASITFIVLGTYYNGQRGASEIETRRSVSQSQYETIARNGALAGLNAGRQALSECFVPRAFEGVSAGATYQVEASVAGDMARVTSMGSILGARDKQVNYTVVTYLQRWNKQVPFEIVDVQTVPEVSYQVETQVLGSEISYNGYRVPVTLKIDIGDASFEPFGPYDSQNHGVEQRPSFTPKEPFAAGTPITISARSWIKSGNGWKIHMEQNSLAGGKQLVVLRNGDDVPTVAGLGGQTSVGEILGPYTENGKIKLKENQSIYLFELGTSNPLSAAFDLQDLVVLVDLAAANDETASWNEREWKKVTKETLVDEDPSACGSYELRLRHYNES